MSQEISSWQSYIAKSSTFKSTWKPDDSRLFYPDYTSWATTVLNGLFNESILQYQLITGIKCLSSPISYICLFKSMTEWLLLSRRESPPRSTSAFPVPLLIHKEKHEAQGTNLPLQERSDEKRELLLQIAWSTKPVAEIACSTRTGFFSLSIIVLKLSVIEKLIFKAHTRTAFLYSCNAI